MQKTPLIQFVGVQKAFGTQTIYEDLTLDVFRGETLVVLGPSGVGKSVMLKMLVGLLRPDAGQIFFDGEEISSLTEKKMLPIRRRISMLFQSGALFDSMTVEENVAFPLREHEKLLEEEIHHRVTQKLEWVGLPGIEKKRPGDLSGGMRKRVGLARAIVSEPEVVLYDEPTTGLDPINTLRISQLIASVQKELRATSIVVTHDIPSAFMVADRLAMFYDKRVRTVLPKSEFQATQDPIIREFIYAMEQDKHA